MSLVEPVEPTFVHCDHARRARPRVAGAGRDGDVRAVAKLANENVGVLLSQMYSWERFFCGNKFNVDTVP